MSVRSAQLPIDFRVIHYIISVRAAFGRLEIGGCIHMAHTEVCEIAQDMSGIEKCKLRLELDAVGRTENVLHVMTPS